MPIATKSQIRSSVLETSGQLQSQKGSLVDDFINITLQEIGDPAWAFDKERHHFWSWLKRKTTFATVNGTADYVMERDVDKIAVMRQTASPTKIDYISDESFLRENPDHTESGNPYLYRLWEIDGVSTRLSAADQIKIVSSSSSDSSAFTVSVLGYVGGKLVTEVLTLNGVTVVTSTNTFDARELFFSKSANTTGNLTVTKSTGGATLVTIGPQEVSPRFKVVTLWPIPSSAITVYVEYYKEVRELVNDSDAPEFRAKWHHVVRVGALCKMYQHLGKTTDFATTWELYRKLVRSMVASDTTEPDRIEHLRKHDKREYAGVRIKLSQDVVT